MQSLIETNLRPSSSGRGMKNVEGLDLAFKETDLKILGLKFDREGGGQGNWMHMLGKVKQRLGFWDS